MKANEARKKYFELYVEFEFSIRRLARRMGVKTKKVSLDNIIDNISSKPEFPSLQISSKLLKRHKQIRNWLAHIHSNASFPNEYEEHCKDIKKIIN